MDKNRLIDISHKLKYLLGGAAGGLVTKVVVDPVFSPLLDNETINENRVFDGLLTLGLLGFC